MQQAYKVLRITELMRVSALGGLEKYYRHTIQTRGGTTLTVDVDERDFLPEKVTTICTAAATNADKILSG
ncbi:MAG: hypothetical protein V1849_01100 [Chloroflexota bacterium]